MKVENVIYADLKRQAVFQLHINNVLLTQVTGALRVPELSIAHCICMYSRLGLHCVKAFVQRHTSLSSPPNVYLQRIAAMYPMVKTVGYITQKEALGYL